VTFNGTVTESAGSTTGIGMLAMTGAKWTFSGATLTTQGSNTIKFYGAGDFHRVYYGEILAAYVSARDG